MVDETSDPRLARALLSLEGLAIGDALGEMHFSRPAALRRWRAPRALPSGPWQHTDDTEMALAIVEVLVRYGEIDQDILAWQFAERFRNDPDRGYGKMARIILKSILSGTHWRAASEAAFSGGGSMGNGSAMRVAPLGAWFADDLNLAVRQAALSAEVTHSHPEGIAGAVAMAAAAATAWNMRGAAVADAAATIWEAVRAHTSPSETLSGIERAQALADTSPEEAGRQLGNGSLVTCPDTVPFVLWSATRHLNDFEKAITETAAGAGDTDTNCAMVGGIVSLFVGADAIPAEWREAKETLKMQEPF